MDASSRRKLQNIFRWYEPVLRARKLPLKHLKALDAIVSCGTADRGSSLYRCDAEDKDFVVNHACRHRSCWMCSQRSRAKWIEAQQERLLNCSHFHVVFTVPQTYRVLWQYNTAWFTKTFFKIASQTLLRLMADRQHQGVTPGVLMTLHTWGRQLSLHPHLHCVVTAGGEDNEGKWKDSGDFLLPIRVVKALYRGLFQSALKEAFENGEIVLPPDHHPADFRRLYRRAYRLQWSVRIEPRYLHGYGVMRYLSRYLRGGPIHPKQIVHCDANQICFRYKDHRDKRHKVLTLKPDEFIRRLLIHVPENGQHVVRHYGLYAGAARRRRNRCREQISGTVECCSAERPKRPITCRCGAPLRLIGRYAAPRLKANSLERALATLPVQQIDEAVKAQAEKTSLVLRL